MTNEVSILMIQDTQRNNAIVGYSIINNQTIWQAVDQLIGLATKDLDIDLNDAANALPVADAIYNYITAS